MLYQQFYIIANILMIVDALVVVGTGYLAYSVSVDMETVGLVMSWYDFIGSVFFLMFANNLFMGQFYFYSPRRFPNTWTMTLHLLAAVALSFLVLATGLFAVELKNFSRIYLLLHFVGTFGVLLVVRLVLNEYLDHRVLTSANSRQFLLVGNADRIPMVAQALKEQPSWGHQLAGCLEVDGRPENIDGLPVLGGLDDFSDVLHEREIDEVVFALSRKSAGLDLESYLDTCKSMGISIRIVPAMFGEPFTRKLRGESIQGIPTLTDYSGTATASGLLYKRILDLMLGFVGFMIFLISYPFVAVAIKLDSHGPVLFKQKRVGMNGRQFYLYKFRSMVVNAEHKKSELLDKSEVSGPLFKMENDPRITRVGSFLRKFSLDEFPQFINVLKGEMSLVGTRPPTLDEVGQYEDWHWRRMSSKPGITGLWQVSGRSEITDFVKVVRLDLAYIDNWRFQRDIEILFKTLWVVLMKKGAK